MDEIRLVRDDELKKIEEWWRQTSNDKNFNISLIYPRNSSFIYKKDGQLMYAVAIHMIKELPVAHIEGFIKNPSQKSDRHAVERLQQYIEGFAVSKGYRLFIVNTRDEKVSQRHKELGYNISNKPLYSGYKLLRS